MKRNDIRTGVIYAYNERDNGAANPVMVVAADTLYQDRHHFIRPGGSRFHRRSADTQVNTTRTGKVGYGVLISYRGTPAERVAALQAIDPGTLRDAFESATNETELPAGVVFAVVNNRFILRAWDEFTAAEAADRQARARNQAERDEQIGRARELAYETEQALAAHGVTVRRTGMETGYRYTLDQAAADKLIELLGQVPTDPMTDDRRDQ